MIGRGGERGLGISVLTARHDEDDDDEPCADESVMLNRIVSAKDQYLKLFNCVPELKYRHSRAILGTI